MGSVCCVARKDRTSRSGSGGESLRRNVIYSPSWSYRWDNRRRVAGEIENSSYEPSHGISTNSSMEIKGDLALERGVFSARGSPLGTFGSPVSQKSPMHDGIGTHTMSSLDSTLAGNDNIKSSTGSPATVDSPAPKSSLSLPSSSSLFSPTPDPVSFQTPLLPTKAAHSRRVHQSPSRHLLRHVSDSRILGLRSPNSNLVSEGRPSFVLSVCSNDTAVGSQGGSSDGWSMRTFSELVASSQRERWSFDSEFLGSVQGKLSESNSTLSLSPCADLRTCGLCSKLLTERSSWRCTELSAVAVLVCGHVYHSECLESVTHEDDQYDPPCPSCTFGEKELSKVAKKLSRAEAEIKSRSYKTCRNRVVERYQDDRLEVLDRRKSGPKMEASSSTRRSFAKPFLRRHFSLGSKWNRSLSDNNSTSSSAGKGFWARYRLRNE